MDQPAPAQKKLTLSLDYRIVCVVLAVIILAMIAVWRPWQPAPSAKDRTVTVTGEARLTAEPDEFVFNPSYQFKEADKDTAIAAMTAKSNSVVAELKKLGVADSKIKTNADGWAYPSYNDSDRTPTYTLSITVTIADKTTAQKVEDYLVTTSPTGTLTPQATFSASKEKSLQAKARDQATKEARAKGEQSAKNLGFKLGAVKSLDDSNGFGHGPIYSMDASEPLSKASTASPQLAVQPGENSLDYSVTVVYYIR
ncbi:MAG TPA: SIMPL domain-containing protein [Candidatus Saccharimonadales bacterium]|nr:SIMPL domain-containing protein [Candidatus Saccharimonadales bacterium]